MIAMRRTSALVITVWILNVVDLLLTLALIHAGATEDNPIMAGLLNKGAMYFALGKLLLVTAGAAILYRHRGTRGAMSGAYICALIYGSVVLYELAAVVLGLSLQAVLS
jgi:hypothetical protein